MRVIFCHSFTLQVREKKVAFVAVVEATLLKLECYFDVICTIIVTGVLIAIIPRGGFRGQSHKSAILYQILEYVM